MSRRQGRVSRALLRDRACDRRTAVHELGGAAMRHKPDLSYVCGYATAMAECRLDLARLSLRFNRELEKLRNEADQCRAEMDQCRAELELRLRQLDAAAAEA